MIFMSISSIPLTACLLLTSFYLLHYDSLIYFQLPILSFYSLELNMTLIVDWMSSLFAMTVCIVSSSIFSYSFSYIPKNEHHRFSLITLLFISSMILLIFSNNVFFIILGWDGLGITSYILVIYYQNHSSNDSGTITILSNRVGDIAIILSMGILFSHGIWELQSSNIFPLIVLFLLTMAAMTKSAQFPFSAWLPAAMAAPTPISALVHSSTLVTAGVFLMIRTMESSPPPIIFTIMIISAITFLFSGMSANWEQDMKKIIALSTLSQIAMMMFTISVKTMKVAFFHLITHAMFKSTLFLCAGVIIHSSTYQDLRSFGTLNFSPPILMTSMGITSMALMGLPFLSGYFSKDAIMEYFFSGMLSPFLISTIIFSIGLTAAYSCRMLYFFSPHHTKTKSDNNHHMDVHMALSITFMTPLSVFLGSFIMWAIIPHQIMMLPLPMKTLTILLVSLGMISGFTLAYKSKTYFTIGFPSVTLWFLKKITGFLPMNFLPLGWESWLTDSLWMETSGPQGAFSATKHISKMPDKTIKMILLSLLLFISSPLLFLHL
uniref:NADH-ubiquinone oxidoreductase chain 5 n=1 Tax=Calisoga longitarsis TaxID=394809 RepID=B2CKV1_9ARAC|nr:NADH dehydrogenase subunit 5 [Calisoga longitarsis]